MDFHVLQKVNRSFSKLRRSCRTSVGILESFIPLLYSYQILWRTDHGQKNGRGKCLKCEFRCGSQIITFIYRGSPPYRPDGISSARRNFRKFCKKNRHINRFDALIFIKLWAMFVNSEHFLNVSTQNMRVGELKNILQTQRNVKA